MSETEDGLSGSLEYNSDLFDAATMERMAGICRLCSKLLWPIRPALSAVPLLTDAERQQLLGEWNAPRSPTRGRAACISSLRPRWSGRRRPSAVVFEDQVFTYRELNQRANQLAHYLRRARRGAGGAGGHLHWNARWTMVVACWGILKAGGAYVPLDPTYPTERLAFMLADSESTRYC